VTPTRPAAVLDQARELREVLETLAAALGRGDQSAVLAAEPALQAVVAAAGRAGVTLNVLGGAGSYSRQGAGQPRAPRGRDLHARV
jgi:hypothetical protein